MRLPSVFSYSFLVMILRSACFVIIGTASAVAAGSEAGPTQGRSVPAERTFRAYLGADASLTGSGETAVLRLSPKRSGSGDLRLRPGELIVSFRPSRALAEASRAISQCAPDARIVDSVQGQPVHLIKIAEANPLSRAALLEDCLERIAPGATVEPNQLMNFFGNQQAVLQDIVGQESLQIWQYLNLGYNGGVVDADADAMEALSRYLHATHAPKPQFAPVVAVADTGMATFHPALKPALWVNYDEIPDNGRDDDRNGLIDDIHGWNFDGNDSQLLDYSGHGTHVAGIIGGRMPQFPRHVGIAPTSRLMVIKLALRTNALTVELFDSLKGTAYAVSNGAHVINMSYGTVIHSPEQDASMTAAHAEGVMLVAAAGNDGRELVEQPVWPCLSPYVFCVANSDTGDRLWRTSNYSDTYEILAAPGTQIWSTSRSEDSGYELKGGTSMAAPLVAGTMAALKSLNPDWSVEQIYGRVLATADRPGTLRPSGTTKRLNVYRALYGPAHLGRPDDGYCDQTIPTPEGPPVIRWQNYPFANSGEAGIDGRSPTRAFTICTQAHLLSIEPDMLNRFFELKRDIEWSKDAAGWNQIGAEITTSGTVNRPFNGVLKGNEHVIHGFRSAGRPWAGLIAELGPRGVVTGLRLQDVDIKSHGMGGAVATISRGTIADVQVEGRIAAKQSVGGIAGDVRGGRIAASYFEGTLESDGAAGGIASRLTFGAEVIDSWFQGRISGSMVGGVTAWAEQSLIHRSHAFILADGAETAGGIAAFQMCKSAIRDSYADGRLTATKQLGGLVANQSDSQIYNSFAVPFLYGAQKMGGLVAERKDGLGTDYEGGSPKHYCDRTTQRPPPSRNVASFYDSVRISNGGIDGIPKSTSELLRRETYAAWPEEPWHFYRGFYPQLGNLPRTQQSVR